MLLGLLLLICLNSCASFKKGTATITGSNEIPFSYFEKDYLVVKVLINGTVEGSFILDTGVGITLLSRSLCRKINCQMNGVHVGKRMSGQEVSIPMSSVSSLTLGSKTQSNFPVGVFDIESLLPGSSIDGFLSLGFFKNFPHTVYYSKNILRFEDENSLRELGKTGTVVPTTPDEQGLAFGIFMPLVLPSGETVQVEVDTGSQSLVLHERYMKSLNVKSTDPHVSRKEGKDETGHNFVRYFSKIQGPVHLLGAKNMKVSSPSVMFQKIIYDGLVGFHFLREFDVTYDLQNSQMIFTPP